MFYDELGTFDYLNPKIIDRIKQELISSSSENDIEIRKERKYLESQLTQTKNKLSILYDDRLAEHISLPLYLEKQKELDENILDIQNQIKKLETSNRKYKEQGITVLELLKDFKNIYARQDWEGKSKILSVVVEKVYLKGDKTVLAFRPPFDIIFTMSQLMRKETVVRKQMWGE